MRKLTQLSAALIAAAAFTASLPAADTSAELRELRERFAALDQQLRILARQIEIKDEAATAAVRTTPVVAAGAGGFSITSGDRGFQLRIRANLQADGRFYISDNVEGNDTFLIRRLRPSFEGTVGQKFGFRIMPDLAPAVFNLLDAYVTYAHSPALNVLVGKTKTPFDLERLVSQTDLLFIERGFPTSLGPNRDLGVQIFGDVAGGKLTYQLAWQNGVPDNGTSITDTDDEKEVAARLFAHPFRGSDSLLAGLGLGVAATFGEKDTGVPAGFRTNAQQTFFSWAAGVANIGKQTRISPQAYYYAGPLGLIGSWVSSKQLLSRAGVSREIDNTAWFAAASYVLTGEDSTYRGVTPSTAFDWAAGTWGAFEIAARYGVLSIDDEAFAGVPANWFANPATSASEAKGTTVGLNWYLNRNVKASINYEHTSFVGGGSNVITREKEQAIFTRVQIRY
jgi:phosphate-selective porin OprO and OprP